MNRLVVRLSVAAMAAITFTAVVPAAAMGAAPSSQESQVRGAAVNLKLTPKIRRQLADVYWSKYYKKNHPKASRSKLDGPTGVYYGKIKGSTRSKDVYWAVGYIGVKGDPISYQDGPHIWRRTSGHAWTYRGDSGGCLKQVPKALLKLWPRLPKC